MDPQECRPMIHLISLTTLWIPFILAYWILCLFVAIFITSLIVPSRLLAQQTEWALPFLNHVFETKPLAKICFEAVVCVVHWTRSLTSPIARTLPSFQIIGCPKAGTTTLASHLRRHPAISGLSGFLLPHETMSKESHFFVGIFGPKPRSISRSRAEYMSLFPTILSRWWTEAVLGHKWLAFDACPVHACLPHVASRMKLVVPKSKIILLVRNPVDALFSAEIMMRHEMGVNDLAWSLTSALTDDEVQGTGGRFSVDHEVEELWSKLEELSFSDPLPSNLPSLFYFRLASHIKCGYLDRILSSYLAQFPAEDVLVVSFNRLVSKPESTVRQVMSFVGADPALFNYKELPPGMKGIYHGKKIHPTVSNHLRSLFSPHVERLERMLGCSLGWGFESFDDQTNEWAKESRKDHLVINLTANPADQGPTRRSGEVEMKKTPCGCWLLA